MYFFDLDWQRVCPLLDGVASLHADFRAALDGLMTSLGLG
jgi:hypothetical protein